MKRREVMHGLLWGALAGGLTPMPAFSDQDDGDSTSKRESDDETFTENEIRIEALRKKEAIIARRIIEGLRVFESKQIDTSIYTKDELIAKLEELSTTKIVT